MPNRFSIKDLPDVSKLVDSQLYLLSGGLLKALTSLLEQIYYGDNVSAGPNIRKKEFGTGGYSLSGTNQDGGSGGISLHAYYVLDASTGSTPAVSVTPGTHNGVVPTVSGNPINVKIGSPPAYPTLTVGGSDTLLYFQIDYGIYGNITSIEIMSGSTMPSPSITPNVAGSDYKLLSNISVSIVAGVASVTPYNDGVSGPQGYAQCGYSSNSWLV